MKLAHIVFLSSLISLTANVLAGEVEYQVCQSLAALYGHNVTPQNLPSNCRNETLANSSLLARMQNSDGSRMIYAANHMLYVDHIEEGQVVKTQLLTGENAKVGEVLSLELDEEHQHLFVLSRHQDGAAFSHYDLNFIGNTAPLRSFKSSDLLGVVSFRINLENKEIYLIDQAQLAIKVYNLYADPYGPKPEHRTTMLRSIQGEQTQILAPVDLALSEEEIFLLESDRVQVFARSAQGNITPTRSIAGVNTGLFNAKMINLDLDRQEVIITNGDKKNLRFNLSAHGDIAPKK
jgi:hypothetical protein